MALSINELLEATQVKVIRNSDEPSHYVNGENVGGTREMGLIFINKDEPKEYQGYTLLHEVGHHIIYGVPSLKASIEMEEEELLAWEIAKWLIQKMGLMPQESFYYWGAVSLETYGYSMEEALRKLKESNIDI